MELAVEPTNTSMCLQTSNGASENFNDDRKCLYAILKFVISYNGALTEGFNQAPKSPIEAVQDFEGAGSRLHIVSRCCSLLQCCSPTCSATQWRAAMLGGLPEEKGG